MHTLFSIDTALLPKVRILCHVDYQQPWVHFTRCIDEYILYYILSGELHIREGDSNYALFPGDYLILEPKLIHTGIKASCCHYFYVHFRAEGMQRIDTPDEETLAAQLIENRRKSIACQIESGYEDVDQYCHLPKNGHIRQSDRIQQMFYQANFDFFTKMEHFKSSVACQFLDILIKIGREFASDLIARGESSQPKIYSKINDIKNFLLAGYKQRITSGMIENKFGMSYDYLNKVFHKMTGYSIYNYLNMVRIGKARELIEVSDMRYSEIAYSVGIDDPFYFSKLFKKYTGLSPSQYWQQHNTLSSAGYQQEPIPKNK